MNLNDPQAFSYTAQYSYDAKDRLTQQVLGGQTLKYSYDPNDNRLTQTKTKSGVTSTVSDTIASDSNRVTARQGSALEYLATGQITRDAARTYRYDEAGRLLSTQRDLQGVSYTYNALGQRIKKVSANNTIYFAYDELGQLLGEYDSQGTMLREYVWLEGRLVGMLSHQLPNQLLSIHTDHLGSVRAVSQGNRVLWRWDGDQFGDVLPNEDVDADGQVLTMPIRHPGQYADVEVGLFYNYYRDYDPVSGRYVESDPIGLKGGTNTYGYVGGSPLIKFDFLGLLQEEAKRCVCTFMKSSNYDSAMAWSNALNRRKSYGWNNPTLRPCENYLYAFAAVDGYGDPYWLIGLGVNFHAAQKLIASSTSPWNVEAYLAGLEGVSDAKKHKDWRRECEGNQC